MAKNSRRIVVKIGTGVLVGKNKKLDHVILENIVRQVTALVKEGHEVLMVSSGAAVSFIARMVFVAGIAMNSRIRNGITVQTTSTVVFSWNW